MLASLGPSVLHSVPSRFTWGVRESLPSFDSKKEIRLADRPHEQRRRETKGAVVSLHSKHETVWGADLALSTVGWDCRRTQVASFTNSLQPEGKEEPSLLRSLTWQSNQKNSEFG
jgi:hypothetical protein